jgi:hypothetical protein
MVICRAQLGSNKTVRDAHPTQLIFNFLCILTRLSPAGRDNGSQIRALQQACI